MLTINPVRERAEALRRIELLDNALIGCGHVCACRARMALVLTAEHMTWVEAVAAEVQAGTSAGGIQALREIIGADINEVQAEVALRIENTMQHPDYVRTKKGGGMAAAERSLSEMLEQELDPAGYAERRTERLMHAILSGDHSSLPAGMHVIQIGGTEPLN